MTSPVELLELRVLNLKNLNCLLKIDVYPPEFAIHKIEEYVGGVKSLYDAHHIDDDRVLIHDGSQQKVFVTITSEGKLTLSCENFVRESQVASLDLEKSWKIEQEGEVVMITLPNLKVVYLKVSGKIVVNKENKTHHLEETDEGTIVSYFTYYSKLYNQMNMLLDSVRTTAYQTAILNNRSDFAGKTVMDVGAGTGILSFFSSQAGARYVYAVEASDVSEIIETLKTTNPILGEKLRVLNNTVEKLAVLAQEKKSNISLSGSGTEFVPFLNSVDILVSEPIGTFLFNERMIESYLVARDAFLKPGGRMFPGKCWLAIAPFSDPALYTDVISRSTGWKETNFYGVNLTGASEAAFREQFRQPIIDHIDPKVIVCQPHFELFNLMTLDREALREIKIPLRFKIESACLIHGLAGWFDVEFDGSTEKTVLSTSPWKPTTHWYQVRFLSPEPIAVNKNQTLSGNIHLSSHRFQSYTVTFELTIEGTSYVIYSEPVDLKDPNYRYYSNPGGCYYPPNVTTHS